VTYGKVCDPESTYPGVMIKLVFCVHRHPDLSEEEFHRTWREDHAPLVRSHANALGIRRYVQSHTAFEPVNEALAGSRGGPPPYDGVAELWFDSIEALVAATGTSEGVAAGEVLLADERRFIDHARSPLFLVEEHAVI
jgi:uncharacterized protein (TIGR02118 family)